MAVAIYADRLPAAAVSLNSQLFANFCAAIPPLSGTEVVGQDSALSPLSERANALTLIIYFEIQTAEVDIKAGWKLTSFIVINILNINSIFWQPLLTDFNGLCISSPLLR